MDVICSIKSWNCFLAQNATLSLMHPNYTTIDPCINFDDYANGGDAFHFHSQNLGLMEFAYRKNMQDVEQDVEFLINKKKGQCDHCDMDDKFLLGQLLDTYLMCNATGPIHDTDHKIANPVYDRIEELFPVEEKEAASHVNLADSDAPKLGELQVYLNEINVDAFLSIGPPLIPSEFGALMPEIGLSPLPLHQDHKKEYASNVNGIAKLQKYITNSDPVFTEVKEGVKKLRARINAIPTKPRAEWRITTPQAAHDMIPILALRDILVKLAPKGYDVLNSPVRVDADALIALAEILKDTPKAAVQGYVFLKTVHRVQPTTWIWRIDSVDWMTQDTKVLAKNKILDMKANVFFPTASPDVNSASDVVAYYKDTLDGRNHFEYEMSWSQWNTKRQWNRLLQKDPPPDWAVAAWQPHSYYYPVTNEFYIGGGMEAFHGLGWPEYMNYAAIGGIASEKMAQALDPKFFLPRNQYGQVVPGAEGGWDNQTIAEYDKRGTCLHDQFAKHGYHPTDYPIHDTVSTAEGNIQNFHTLGTETDQESVFDFGAVDVAYEAWKRQAEKDPWKARRHSSLKNFTADQLFFISYAQAHYHNNEAHSESRIISLQENSKAFKDAFRCKQKEPVCPLW
ncbi:hypothetical protein G7054_g3210 [Neopestalotiopsis clavispora]|nr:hypothetical protein G7054_g3210 [Neopestalotiopsis clavispora]